MLTPQQKEIIVLCREYGGVVTKKQVVEAFGSFYYTNGAFHLGNILSRMVNANLLVRVKPGVFQVGTGKKSKPSTIADGQTTLFEL